MPKQSGARAIRCFDSFCPEPDPVEQYFEFASGSAIRPVLRNALTSDAAKASTMRIETGGV